MPGLRFQHFYLIPLLCLSEKMSSLEKCVVSNRRVGGLSNSSSDLDPLQTDANSRVLKAVPVHLSTCLPALRRKQVKSSTSSQPVTSAHSPALPLPVLEAMPRGVESCAGSSRGAPTKRCGLHGADGVWEQRGSGRSRVICTACGLQTPDIPPPACGHRSRRIPEECARPGLQTAQPGSWRDPEARQLRSSAGSVTGGWGAALGSERAL